MAEQPSYVPGAMPQTGNPQLQRYLAEELERIRILLDNLAARVTALEP